MDWDRQINSDGDTLADALYGRIAEIAAALERIADYFDRDEERAETLARHQARATAAIEETNARQRREEIRHHPDATGDPIQ